MAGRGVKLIPRGFTVAGERSDPEERRAFLYGLEGCGRTEITILTIKHFDHALVLFQINHLPNTAFGCEIPAGGLGTLKLFSCDGLRDPAPLPEPDPEQPLEPELGADPESAEEVERAEDRYVGGAAPE